MIRYGMEANSKSAMSVVMPASTADSEYRGPNANSMSVSDLATCVEERWIMVTSASCSHKAAQMSWAELLEPRTTHFLPAVVVDAAELAGMLLRPSERVGPGDPRDVRHAGHARRQDQLPGPQHDRLPFTVDGHRPVLRVFMIFERRDRGWSASSSAP